MDIRTKAYMYNTHIYTHTHTHIVLGAMLMVVLN